METPETKWGREFVTSCYSEDPAMSWQKITEKMKSGFQNAGDKEITKMLGIKYPGSESRPIKPEKEKKTHKPRSRRPQELPWPENLMTEIGLEKVFPETRGYTALTEDQMAGLSYAIGKLKEKEQTVIRLRYEQHRTLKATGEASDKEKSEGVVIMNHSRSFSLLWDQRVPDIQHLNQFDDVLHFFLKQRFQIILLQRSLIFKEMKI